MFTLGNSSSSGSSSCIGSSPSGSSSLGSSSCTSAEGDSKSCGDYGSLPAPDCLFFFWGFLMKSVNRVSSSTFENFTASTRTNRLSSLGFCAFTDGAKGVSSIGALDVFLFGDGALSSFKFLGCFLFAPVQEGLLLGPLLVLAGSFVSFSAAIFLCSYFNNASQVML